MIAPTKRVSQKPHIVLLENPSGAPVRLPGGGFKQAWVTVASVFAAIEPATAHNVEQLMAGTVGTNSTHIITCEYWPGITTKSQVKFNGRIFHIVGVQNINELNIDLRLACEEVTA
jgi:SPP1 family predicted phage head-tail adaptor